jgi:hypothetical protein
MKNIYLYQTDQPTGIFETNSGLQFSIMNKVRYGEFKGYHIYITSSEEIKEGDWYLNIEEKNGIKNPFYGKLYKANQSICQVPLDYLVNNLKKIILTTDPTLIVDSVQSISDEFLLWFVKNSSCEFVDVEERRHFEADKSKRVNPLNGFYYSHKIIIPQEGYICPHTKIQCDDECCVSAEDCHITSSLASGTVDYEEQKQYLINMMHDDEELGLYEEPKYELLPDFNLSKGIFDKLGDLSSKELPQEFSKLVDENFDELIGEEPKQDWYCPKCQSYVSSESVTFEETHQTCNTSVIIEEAAENHANLYYDKNSELASVITESIEWENRNHNFIAGAKWQAERIGLMEIELRHTKTLLASCEKSLEDRDNKAKRMYNDLDILKNDIYSKLPTKLPNSNVGTFELLKIIKNHLQKLDDLCGNK